jgi:hypothetical protein
MVKYLFYCCRAFATVPTTTAELMKYMKEYYRKGSDLLNLNFLEVLFLSFPSQFVKNISREVFCTWMLVLCHLPQKI